MAVNRGAVHSVYADGTMVLEGDQPPRIAGPDISAAGQAHSVIRWDRLRGRIYQLREYDAQGRPVRDVDFTNPTYPSGRLRPGHPGPPHQHRWLPVVINGVVTGVRRSQAERIP